MPFTGEEEEAVEDDEVEVDFVADGGGEDEADVVSFVLVLIGD